MDSPVQSGGMGRDPESRARRRLLTSRGERGKERGKGKRKEEGVEMQERTANSENLWYAFKDSATPGITATRTAWSRCW